MQQVRSAGSPPGEQVALLSQEALASAVGSFGVRGFPPNTQVTRRRFVATQEKLDGRTAVGGEEDDKHGEPEETRGHDDGRHRTALAPDAGEANRSACGAVRRRAPARAAPSLHIEYIGAE